MSHELPDGNPLKIDSEALDCHNTRIVRAVPVYLDRLPKDKIEGRPFKEMIPEAVARCREDNPSAKRTTIYKKVAEQCGCDDSTVRYYVKVLGLF